MEQYGLPASELQLARPTVMKFGSQTEDSILSLIPNQYWKYFSIFVGGFTFAWGITGSQKMWLKETLRKNIEDMAIIYR